MSTPRNTIEMEMERQNTTPKSVKQERKTDGSCISIEESVYQRSDSEQQENNAKLFIAIRKKNKSQQEKLEKIRQLSEKNPKPNINAQDGNDNGNTSLHMAVDRGYLKIVNFLLQNGAESTLENNHHKTPLMLARELNNQEIITALENHAPQARRLDNTADQQSAGLSEKPMKQQSERHEEYRGNIAEVRVSDHDPQPGSLSDGKIQSILPPFSGELAVDTDLKLSRSNFRQSLETLVKGKGLSNTEQLNALPLYPTPYVLAQFASQAYQDYKPKESDRNYEKRLGLPEGWKLLTTAVNQETNNGYFGAAYWHPERQQVVIAHRGTNLTTIGAGWADIMGVVFKNYVPQMNSAATFADEVNQVLYELNKQLEVNFQLFFTGHSLGGWLSQITAFTTKYLKNQGAYFQRDTSSTNYHVHTVVFDSPGCEAMLSQMQKIFDVRHSGRSIYLDDLDITSYLSAPNRINTCNSHLGMIYRIFTDLSDMSMIAKHTVAYTLAAHRMDKILQAFNPTTGQVCRDNQLKIQEVIDWPISARLTRNKEWKNFFNWAQHLNSYHPDITDELFQIEIAGGYYPVRYQTKLYNGRSSSLNVFTYAEQQFLDRYHWLREFKEFSKPGDLFSEINDSNTQKCAQEKLQNFKIENQVIRCTDARALQEFIPYIKRLIQLFPQIQEKTKQTLSSFYVRKKVYQYETAHCLQAIQQYPIDINSDVIGLEDFLKEPQQRVWQLVVEKNSWIGLIKVYRSWQKMRGNGEYQREDRYTILKLKRLLTIHQQISLSELLNSPEITHHLLIVDCNVDKIFYLEAAEQLFTELLNVLNNKSDIKIIVITKNSDGITELFNQKAETVLNNQFRTTKDAPLTWSHLSSDAQQKLLEKKVDFQGYQVSLNQLIDPEKKPELTNLIPLQELINNQLVIGDRLPISSGYDEDFYIDRTFNHQIAIKEDIFYAKQQQNFSDLLASTEQEFKQFCRQHPRSNIHWLMSEPGSKFVWQQSKGSLAVLREYIETHHIHSYSPEMLNDFLQQAQKHKIMLISDTAGMGKTTVLTHLSKQLKQKFPTHWVVRIDLNDHTDALKALTEQGSKGLSSDSAVEFFSQKLLRLKTPLEQVIFTHSFEPDGKVKVAILLDGFDKISPSYKDTFIKLLQILRESSVEQLWVTTRPHMKGILEDQLQQLSYTLEPFSPENQINFLTRFWKKELTFPDTSQQQLSIYAEMIIKKLAKSISDKETKFSGIPLHTLMLADSFKPEVELSYRFTKDALELPNRLDLIGLYERFIYKKYSIYQAEKTNARVSNVAAEEQRKHALEDLRKVHQQLALQVLFNKTQFRLLQADDTQSKFSNEELAKIGIIQIIDDKPHFIHRTFAEYFASDFLVTQLTEQTQRQEVQDFILKEILQQKDYQVIRAFLNGLLKTLKKEFAPSEEVSKQYGKRINELWKQRDSLRKSNRTILHIAYGEGNTKIVIFLLNSLENQKEKLKRMMLETTKDGETILHEAAGSENWELVTQLLDYVQDNFESSTPGTLKSLVLATTKDGETVLHKGVKSGKWELVKQLLNYVQDNVESSAPGTMKSLVLATTKDGETVLYEAAGSGNWELVKQLLNYVQDNFESSAPGTLKSLVLANATGYRGGTVLHNAVKSENWDLVKQLLNYVQDNVESSAPGTLKSLVLATTKDGETVLYDAAGSGNWELVKKLLNYVQDNFESSTPGTLKSLVLANATGYRGGTVLHNAVKSENWDLVKQLLNYVQDNVESSTPGTLKSLVLATTKDGETVLHKGVKSEKWELVKQLLNYVQDNVESSTPGTLKSLVLATTKDGETVLHKGVKSEKWELVKQLLNYVQDNVESSAPGTMKSLVLATAKDGETILYKAAGSGNWELVKQLLNYVQDNFESSAPGTLKSLVLANATGYRGGTVLHNAAKSGNWELVKQLLEYMQNNFETNAPGTLKSLVLATTKDGETVLHEAAGSKNWELVKQLLNYVQDNFESSAPGTLKRLVLATTKDGETVLHKGVKSGNWDLVKQLLDYVKDNVESSAPGTLKSLVLATQSDGETVLHQAAGRGNGELVEKLLGYVQDNVEFTWPGTLKSLVLATTTYGETVLHPATRKGHVEVLEKLWEWGQDKFSGEVFQALLDYVKKDKKTLEALVVAKNEYCQTILQLAAKEGHIEVVKNLLNFIKENLPEAFKVLVEAKDKDGQTALHQSALQGQLEVIQHLIDNGADVSAVTKYNRTPLHLAVKENYKQIIKILLDNKADINAKDCDGNTPLDLATKEGRKEIKSLLEKADRRKNYSSYEYQTILNFFNGKSSKEDINNYLKINNIDVNAKGPNCETLLHLSIEKRRKDVVEWLLTEEADIHLKTDIGEVPLHLAARAGDEEIVELLLNNRCKIDAINDFDETALHEAARTGQEKVVELLLGKEASIQITTCSGDTALHKATVNGHEKVVKILLDKGSDVNAKNYMGETALHIAARANSANIVDLLLEKSPKSICTTTSLGDTVLHLAVKTGKKEMVQYLIKKAKDELDEQESVIYKKNSKGNMAIHEAVERGNKEVTKLFLDQYNSISDTTDSGNTYLHLAVNASKKEMIEFLLQNGGKSRINAKNNNRETPLHLAARSGDITIAQLLIDNDAEITATTSRNMLHYAVDTAIKDENRIKQNIDYYISKGIKIDDQDKKGITALHLAARKGYIEVVEYLIEKHIADVKIEDNIGRKFIHYLASGLYRKCQEASKLIMDGISEDYFIQKFESIYNNRDFSDSEQAFLKLYNIIADVIKLVTNKNHQDDIHIHKYDEEIEMLLNEIKKSNTNDKELINLLYSPAVLLSGLNTALLGKHSKETLRKPELGIAISQLTKLHDSIDEYLNQSHTVTQKESKIDSNKLFNKLIDYYGSNSKDIGNNQMEPINKDIYSLNLIEKYLDPICQVNDSQLLKFIIQRAFQVVGECVSKEASKGEGKGKERVLSVGTKTLLEDKIPINLPKLRNILSHVKSFNTLLARMIVEKYYENFDRVGNDLKGVKDLVLEIRNQISENSSSENLSNNNQNNNDVYMFIKSFNEILTELSKMASEKIDKKIIGYIKEFLSDKTEDFKKENKRLRENFVQDKAKKSLPNLVSFFIQDRLIDLKKQYNSLSINNDAGRLQAIEFFILDLSEAINFVLFDKDSGILEESPELKRFFVHRRLRNYLAHGDVLCDTLMSNSKKMIIDNAKISLNSGKLAFSIRNLLFNIEKDGKLDMNEENKSFFKKLILSSQKTKFLEIIKNKLDAIYRKNGYSTTYIIEVSLVNLSDVIEQSEHIGLTQSESEEGPSCAKNLENRVS